ncbi:MAG: DUF4920 domain-containing protein [Elusimicrobia bacterium]|nr:DUF4920 domain-containing protein [Elusimicrobiota bacterium]
MTKIVLFAALCLASFPAAADAAKSVKYGKGVQAGAILKISDLQARIGELEGKTVRVEGPVVGVCAKRGCWIKIAGDKEFSDIRFKVNDGEIVFPMSVQGKYAVVEGIAHKTTLTLPQTVDFLKEQAEESGAPFDASKVKAPLSFVTIKGAGAVVRERK